LNSYILIIIYPILSSLHLTRLFLLKYLRMNIMMTLLLLENYLLMLMLSRIINALIMMPLM